MKTTVPIPRPSYTAPIPSVVVRQYKQELKRQNIEAPKQPEPENIQQPETEKELTPREIFDNMIQDGKIPEGSEFIGAENNQIQYYTLDQLKAKQDYETAVSKISSAQNKEGSYDLEKLINVLSRDPDYASTIKNAGFKNPDEVIAKIKIYADQYKRLTELQELSRKAGQAISLPGPIQDEPWKVYAMGGGSTSTASPLEQPSSNRTEAIKASDLIPQYQIPAGAKPDSPGGQTATINGIKYYIPGSTMYDKGFRTFTEFEKARSLGQSYGPHEGGDVPINTVLINAKVWDEKEKKYVNEYMRFPLEGDEEYQNFINNALYSGTDAEWRAKQKELTDALYDKQQQLDQGDITKTEFNDWLDTAKNKYNEWLKEKIELGTSTNLLFEIGDRLLTKNQYETFQNLKGEAQFDYGKKLGIYPEDSTYITRGDKGYVVSEKEALEYEKALREESENQKVKEQIQDNKVEQPADTTTWQERYAASKLINFRDNEGKYDIAAYLRAHPENEQVLIEANFTAEQIAETKKFNNAIEIMAPFKEKGGGYDILKALKHGFDSKSNKEQIEILDSVNLLFKKDDLKQIQYKWPQLLEPKGAYQKQGNIIQMSFDEAQKSIPAGVLVAAGFTKGTPIPQDDAIALIVLSAIGTGYGIVRLVKNFRERNNRPPSIDDIAIVKDGHIAWIQSNNQSPMTTKGYLFDPVPTVKLPQGTEFIPAKGFERAGDLFDKINKLEVPPMITVPARLPMDGVMVFPRPTQGNARDYYMAADNVNKATTVLRETVPINYNKILANVDQAQRVKVFNDINKAIRKQSLKGARARMMQDIKTHKYSYWQVINSRAKLNALSNEMAKAITLAGKRKPFLKAYDNYLDKQALLQLELKKLMKKFGVSSTRLKKRASKLILKQAGEDVKVEIRQGEISETDYQETKLGEAVREKQSEQTGAKASISTKQMINVIAAAAVKNALKTQTSQQMRTMTSTQVKNMLKQAQKEAQKKATQEALKTDTITQELTKTQVITATKKAVRANVNKAARAAAHAATAESEKVTPRVNVKENIKEADKTDIAKLNIPPGPMADDKAKRAFLSRRDGFAARRRGMLHGKDVYLVDYFPYGPKDKLVIIGDPPAGAKEVKGKGSMKLSVFYKGKLPEKPIWWNTGAIDDVVFTRNKRIEVESVKDTDTNSKKVVNL